MLYICVVRILLIVNYFSLLTLIFLNRCQGSAVRQLRCYLIMMLWARSPSRYVHVHG